MATEQLLSLVEYIAYKAGSMYISDLRNMSTVEKRHALGGMKYVKENTYELSQWNEALRYIMNRDPVNSVNEARKILEEFFQDEDVV